MSGPIIRKYGFPNFEKIFGDRPPPHGLDPEPSPPGNPPDTPAPDQPVVASDPKKPDDRSPALPTE